MAKKNGFFETIKRLFGGKEDAAQDTSAGLHLRLLLHLSLLRSSLFIKTIPSLK